ALRLSGYTEAETDPASSDRGASVWALACSQELFRLPALLFSSSRNRCRTLSYFSSYLSCFHAVIFLAMMIMD
ncbi:mCG122656, isoform CRA_c, partial [Mus musculus]